MAIRFVTRGLAALALIAALVSPVAAQNYPERPIRMIVSIAAGSLTDVIMRAAANELSPRLGQPIVIENRGGAAGIPGAQACTASAGDGYTICVVFHNQLSFNPVMFTNLPYDVDKDGVITRLFFLIESLAVHPSINVNTVAELRTLAQSKATKLNWGTLGQGSAPELFLRWINNQWRTDIVGIPYRGGGPMAQALAANDVQVAGVGLGNFLGLAEGGKIKIVAVSATRRSPLAPNVMTFQEAGLDGYKQRGWWGLAAPKGTPEALVSRLNTEFVRLFSGSEFCRLPRQTGGGCGSNHACGFRGVRQGGSPARRKPRQAREHAGPGVQARRSVAFGRAAFALRRHFLQNRVPLRGGGPARATLGLSRPSTPLQDGSQETERDTEQGAERTLMTKPLASRIALVTGASRGIGYATAIALAREGAHIVATARTPGGLEELDDAIARRRRHRDARAARASRHRRHRTPRRRAERTLRQARHHGRQRRARRLEFAARSFRGQGMGHRDRGQHHRELAFHPRDGPAAEALRRRPRRVPHLRRAVEPARRSAASTRPARPGSRCWPAPMPRRPRRRRSRSTCSIRGRPAPVCAPPSCRARTR